METTIQHIELINQYLNNLLSGDAKSSFIQKLEVDSEFNQLYQEQVVMVGGINRIGLKQEILKANETYIKNKWIKFSAIGIVILGIFVLLYIFLLNPKNTESNQPLKEVVPVSIQVEKNSEKNHLVIKDSIVEIDETLAIISSESATIQKAEHSFNSYEKQSQLSIFDNSKDTIIRLKEGTILNIKANSFVDKNTQKAVKGRVNLEVTEYYKLSDMLMANLTTTSNGELLETGGMLYLKASQNDSILKLKENETITISFPKKKKKEDMQMFSGNFDTKGMNWTLESDQDELIVPEPEVITVPFSIVEEIPIFPGCENISKEESRQCFNDGMNQFMQRNFNTNLLEQLSLTGKQRIVSTFQITEKGDIQFIQSNASRSELIEEANRVIGLLPKMKPGKQRSKNVIVPYSFPIYIQIQDDSAINRAEKKQSSDSLQVPNILFVKNAIAYDTITTLSRGMVEKIREVMHDADFVVDQKFMQQWDDFKNNNMIRELNKSTEKRTYLIRKQVFEMKESRFKILEDDSITRGGHVIRIPWDESKIQTTSTVVKIVPKQMNYIGAMAVTSEEFENQVNDGEKSANISTRDVNNYILKTAKLGWINCDRFINGKTARIKYKLKIKNSENTIVNMVFKNTNSVIPSWKSDETFDFGTVSDATDVVLVAIKKEQGKLFLDIVDVKTSILPKVDFNMKEVSLEEMKIELQKLNALFD